MAPKGQNLWTEDQRTILHILNAEYSFSNEDRTALFKHIFADHLENCGVTNRITTSVLSSNYADRNRRGRDRFWKDAIGKVAAEKGTWEGDQQHGIIREAARVLGIEIVASNATEEHVQGTAKKTSTLTKKAKASIDAKKASLLPETDVTNSHEEDDATEEADSGFTMPYVTRLASKKKANGVAPLEEDQDDDEPMQDADSGFTMPYVTRQASKKKAKEFASLDDDHDDGAPMQVDGEPTQDESAGPQLKMVHRDDVHLDPDSSGDYFMSFFTDIADFVDHKSLVYRAGGQVARLKICNYDDPSAGEDSIDCMVCDRDVCETCVGKKGTNATRRTHGLPIVHSSDTKRENGITIFDPVHKENISLALGRYTRTIQFESSDGIVSLEAMICGYVECRYCSTSEHRRVIENKDLED